MSYRNSERKTQEMMHATIALAVALVARAMLLRRRFFCEEDEEDKVGSIDILSLFFACGDDDAPFSLSLKEARFSLAFFSNGFFPIHFAAL